LMKSLTYRTTPTPVLDLLPSLIAPKTNRPQIKHEFFLYQIDEKISIVIYFCNSSELPLTAVSRISKFNFLIHTRFRASFQNNEAGDCPNFASVNFWSCHDLSFFNYFERPSVLRIISAERMVFAQLKSTIRSYAVPSAKILNPRNNLGFTCLENRTKLIAESPQCSTMYPAETASAMTACFGFEIRVRSITFSK
ncbi:hypothetical protein AAKU61_004249, partial [Undibacterium sp. GrIS 1.2]